MDVSKMNGYKKYVYMSTVLLSSIQTALFYQTAMAAAITSKITVNRVFDTGGSVIYRFTPVDANAPTSAGGGAEGYSFSIAGTGANV